jgi:hypothetical protein
MYCLNVQKFKGQVDPGKLMQLDMLCKTIADIYSVKITLDVALKDKRGEIAQFVEKIKQSDEYSKMSDKVIEYNDVPRDGTRDGKTKKKKRRKHVQKLPAPKDTQVVASGLPGVTRDFMIQKYGLMPLAMKNFRNFYSSTQHFRGKRERVRMFALLSGCAGEPGQKYHPDMINYYTQLLIKMTGGGSEQQMAERMSTGANPVSVERRLALSAVTSVFPSLKKKHPERFQQLLNAVKNLPGVPRSNIDSRVVRTEEISSCFDTTFYVDMESVLATCLEVWELESTASVTIAIKCVGFLQSFARMSIVIAAIRKLKSTKIRLMEVYKVRTDDSPTFISCCSLASMGFK